MRRTSLRFASALRQANELPGFFLQHAALNPRGREWEWECPWCSYSLLFSAQDRAAAEPTARAHVLSAHGVRLWDDMVHMMEIMKRGRG